jgi:hypothetical protein
MLLNLLSYLYSNILNLQINKRNYFHHIFMSINNLYNLCKQIKYHLWEKLEKKKISEKNIIYLIMSFVVCCVFLCAVGSFVHCRDNDMHYVPAKWLEYSSWRWKYLQCSFSHCLCYHNHFPFHFSCSLSLSWSAKVTEEDGVFYLPV